jgi:hypothetical protein
MGRLWGISMIAPQNVVAVQDSNSLRVTWNNLALIEPSISGYRVYYGLSTSTMSTSVDVGNATSTTISSGLTSGQTYYISVRGYDNDAFSLNYTGTSTHVSVTYIEDAIAPTVEVTAPTSLSTVSGSSVALTASSSDNIDVAGVSFYINNTQIGSEDTAAPYSITWDSTATTSGSRSIVAVARDTAGNRATSTSVTFSVLNAGYTPTSIQASSTSDGAVITWSTTVLASSKVDFGLSSDSLASTTQEFDTTPRVTSHSARLRGLVPCTQYSYTATSRNALSESATSSVQTFTTAGCTENATVSSITSNSISVTSGGSVVGDSVTLTVPADITASTSQVIFRISALSQSEFFASLSGPSGKVRATAGVFNLRSFMDEATVISTFDEPISITMSYQTSEITGIEETSLRIYRYDGSVWSALSNCTVNTSANTVTCQTTAFSEFALFGDAPSEPEPEPEPEPTTPASTRRSGGGRINRNLIPQFASATAIIQPATPSTPATQNTYVFNVSLRFGTTNDDVQQLQSTLNKLGYTVTATGPGSVGNETRYFGRATEAAVRKYQREHGLPATGFFGPLTRQSLNAKIQNSAR